MGNLSTSIMPDDEAGVKLASLGKLASGLGGILHLPDALRANPDKHLVLYNRCSARGSQTGPDNIKLLRKTTAVAKQVRQMMQEMGEDRKIKPPIVEGVEEGRLSKARPLLEQAIETALRKDCILVAPDTSRFLRSEAYHRQNNNQVEPTDEEWEAFYEMTKGVPLATVEPPDLAESERHRRSIRRGKPGRPRTICKELAAEIAEWLGARVRSKQGRERFANRTIRKAAKKFGKSVTAIHRALHHYLAPSGVPWHVEMGKWGYEGGGGMEPFDVKDEKGNFLYVDYKPANILTKKQARLRDKRLRDKIYDHLPLEQRKRKHLPKLVRYMRNTYGFFRSVATDDEGH